MFLVLLVLALQSSLPIALKRVGFTPRLPKSAKSPQFGIVDPVRAEVKISVADLNQALRDAKAANVTVPQNWDGITIAMQQGQGILADYDDFIIVQAPALALLAP